ncbi:hypothetical protein GGI43DRAFT_381720 [Trichoderma evansii]
MVILNRLLLSIKTAQLGDFFGHCNRPDVNCLTYLAESDAWDDCKSSACSDLKEFRLLRLEGVPPDAYSIDASSPDVLDGLRQITSLQEFSARRPDRSFERARTVYAALLLDGFRTLSVRSSDKANTKIEAIASIADPTSDAEVEIMSPLCLIWRKMAIDSDDLGSKVGYREGLWHADYDSTKAENEFLDAKTAGTLSEEFMNENRYLGLVKAKTAYKETGAKF